MELKAERGRPSALQEHEIGEIRRSGGYATILYPKDFERFKEEIMELENMEGLIADYRRMKAIADSSASMLDDIKKRIESLVGTDGYNGETFKVTWVPVKEKTVVDWDKFAKAEPEDAAGIIEDYPKKSKTGGYFKYTDKEKKE